MSNFSQLTTCSVAALGAFAFSITLFVISHATPHAATFAGDIA